MTPVLARLFIYGGDRMPRDWEDGGESPEASGRPADEATSRAARARHAQKREAHALESEGRFGKAVLGADKFFWGVLALAVLLSGYDLYRRLSVEWRHRTVGIAVEYRDLALLSRQSGESPEAIFRRMRERGASGITASELTGKDLAAGFLPVYYGSLATFRPILKFAISAPLDRAAILIENSEPMLQPMVDYLRIRYSTVLSYSAEEEAASGDRVVSGDAAARRGIITLTTNDGTLVVLPVATDELADAGVLPDFSALSFASRAGAAAVYRPLASPGVDSRHTADGLRWLKGRYPSISCVVPAGQIVAGYPELAPVTGTLKDIGATVGQAEFVRQIGVSELYSAMKPAILPLHSLVKDELISRRYSRPQIIERMVRAVHERSIRILLLRPYELYSVGKLEPFIEDMGRIRDALETRSYNTGWPEAMPMFASTVGAAVGLAAAFTLCLWSYARRYAGYDAGVSVNEISAVAVCSLALGVGAWALPAVSRMLGGLSTAMFATEAAIWAMDRYEKPVHGLLAGLLIVLSGGLTVAAHYGATNSMLRLAPFSGVKLTLLLPPALILAHDLKRRVHPESMLGIMTRPPLWGELMIMGIALVAAVVMTVRSDNASFVPGWEVRFRDMLERVLWVRPRTKEFLLGYPSLIIYYVASRRDWVAGYREVFRIGASLAFSSAVNSFCHFHTLLPLTAIRVVNGWLLGIAVGFVALVFIDYVGGPAWRAARGLCD
jgi:hypothetical protein